MSISNDTVAKVAKLARISNNPSEEFLDKYRQELSGIIEYVDQLKEIDTKGIKPTDGVRTILVEELREDVASTLVNNANYQKTRNNIISNFPNKKGNLLVLPGIFEEN
jgi:aspartyl-tRNA(Asn)/glutamyl-tRNA(Gln) amidotransferase subunit C